MARYFFEVSYKGTGYAGFQVQLNANTIQAELEKALAVYLREPVSLTGSSRTDKGVHALQNFFHADIERSMPLEYWEKVVYHINAILPLDIVLKRIVEMPAGAHCRFDAMSRSYEYRIYQQKDPFIFDWAYYYPYGVDIELLNEAAAIVRETTDFTTFSKHNSQVKSFICHISESYWLKEGEEIRYRVSGNRFLRGMVRGLVGTMLKVGRGKISIPEFRSLISAGDSAAADFSVPAKGLALHRVLYKNGI